jgi:hypothetical protein
VGGCRRESTIRHPGPRVTFSALSRALAVLAACLVLAGHAVAAADAIDTSVHQLGTDDSYKVRLAAALALAKAHDPRAVIALAGSLRNDGDAAVRRISALALEKMIDARTPADARELGLSALDAAAASDADTGVRDTAVRALKSLSGLRKVKPKLGPRGDKPEVFVNIDPTTDQSNKLPSGTGDRLMRLLKRSIETTGYATSWPGGLPTSAELTSNRSRAFIVASTVKKIEITKAGGQTHIACTVAVRIAPWLGKDGGEKWEANRAASASGSAKATTSNRDRDIQSGLRDCVEAVAEDVTSRQVLPFLKQVASAK